MFIKRFNAIFVTFAIVLGLLFLVWATSQFDIDVGRKMAKGESQKAAVQE